MVAHLSGRSAAGQRVLKQVVSCQFSSRELHNLLKTVNRYAVRAPMRDRCFGQSKVASKRSRTSRLL